VTNTSGFTGVLTAFNNLRLANGETPKQYSPNWGGLLEAVVDIKKEWSTASVGEYPPGWSYSIADNGDITSGWAYAPETGHLWFDERQGRLMVFINDDYYQANGADSLAVIASSAPTDPTTGGLWLNSTNNNLYLYNGSSWILVSSSSTSFTTDVLLLDSTNKTSIQNNNSNLDVLTEFSASSDSDYNQEKLNAWIIAAMLTIDGNLNTINLEPNITISASAPSSPINGSLWYDTSNNILKVSNSSSWVDAVNLTATTASITTVQSNLTDYETSNNTRSTTIESDISTLQSNLSNYATTSSVNTIETSLQNSINTISTLANGHTSNIDNASTLHGVAKDSTHLGTFTGTTIDDNVTIKAALQALETSLDSLSSTTATASVQTEIDSNVNDLITLTGISENTSNLGTFTGGTISDSVTIKAALQALETKAEANSTSIAAISVPDISGKLDTSTHTAYVSTVGSTYLPFTGGTLTGTLTINPSLSNTPTLDFSANSANAQDILKLQATGATGNYTTLGTTSNNWEVAWEFNSNEDFCWVHNTNGKVFSISKDGPICENITIGTFGTNDSGGVVVTNEINVKNTITSIQSDISTLQTDVTALQTTDAAVKEIYYSDTAPTGSSLINGDLWFDSTNLRLCVRHSDAWLFSDRVEDTAFKTALYNAVNGSTDYASLKSALLTALN
tara:strand:- start:3990 stop:6029 length:2040 start_codon:yes stop_codon:yes gene_type:complete